MLPAKSVDSITLTVSKSTHTIRRIKFGNEKEK
jgi:hypothetical protein